MKQNKNDTSSSLKFQFWGLHILNFQILISQHQFVYKIVQNKFKIMTPVQIQNFI